MERINVSVIVPVYNGALFIENTLQMVLQSSLESIEIIVIDDGSSDNSVAICKKIATLDSRVKLICQKNTGVSGARNHGLRIASGEYVCFCDQDDIVENDAYKKMYECAQLHSCDVVMSSTGKVIGNNKETFEKLPNSVLDGEHIKEKCLLPILFNGTTCHSVEDEIRMENDIWKCMIKREFIVDNDIVFRHYVNYEDDFLFLLDVLARAKRVATIQDVLYYWRVNLKSETHNTPYVEDLYNKDIYLQKEILRIMEIAQIKREYIEMYKKCQNCNRYIHMIENENRAKNKKWKDKLSYLKIIKLEPEFVESLDMRNKYKMNLIHRKIILFMLERGCFRSAYLFHRIYVYIRKKGLKFQWWTTIENYLYNKKEACF